MKRRTLGPRWPALTAALLAGLFLADIALFAFLPIRLLCPALPAAHGRPVAVVAVLFNGFTKSPTGINAETRRRLQHGLSLLRSDRVRFLLVDGGTGRRKG